MDEFARLQARDRKPYFEQVAADLGFTPLIVEKDFWVCWTLKRLFALSDIGPNLVFKGGTSLSKGYQAIKRFSEDIDLSLDRAFLGFGGAEDPERQTSKSAQKKARKRLIERARETIREELVPALRASLDHQLGPSGWTLSLDDEEDGTILFAYPDAVGTSGVAGHDYFRSLVKIEVGGRGDQEPSADRVIESYVARRYPAAFTEPTVQVNVLAVERTFWEKATILHVEHHRPADKPSPGRHSRHYYDLFRLTQMPTVAPTPELLERVATHKALYFECAWAKYGEAKKGTLRLVPPDSRLDELRDDYRKMQEMFFPGESVPLDDLMNALREWEDRFNAG